MHIINSLERLSQLELVNQDVNSFKPLATIYYEGHFCLEKQMDILSKIKKNIRKEKLHTIYFKNFVFKFSMKILWFFHI